MADSKDAADVTSTPEGLDVAVTQPGTIVGSHDLQGTDGTTRTDRPGDILGTPVVSSESHARTEANRQLETARTDSVTAAVDRANREELPRLGGPVQTDWEPDEDAPDSAKASFKAAQKTLAALPATPAVPAAPAAPRDSGIKVKPGVERG